MEKRVVVLGAGVAGLSASYHLRKNGIKSIVYEKESTYGGLCNSFNIEGFTFDTFAHLAFSKDKIVNSLFEGKTDYFIHDPNALNYYEGKWIKNPVQNNLYNLDLMEKVNIIKDFINKREVSNIKNYEDWLRSNYGDYFTDTFPAKYTRKYWTVNPNELEPNWVNGRMYIPSLEEILIGAMSNQTPTVHYSKEMHYPQKGGYKEFLKPLAKESEIVFNKKIKLIYPDKKQIVFCDDEMIKYDSLISTIPLPELCQLINNVPKNILEASKRLDYTSGIIISLGLKKVNTSPALWFYVYDENIYPARVYSPSWKSPNNAPKGCSSLQAEVYFSTKKELEQSVEEIGEKTIEQLINMKLFKKEDIIIKDIKVIKYANILFTHNIYKERNTIKDYLDKIEIGYAGRFGEWDYLWSDQSLLSGKEAADSLYKSIQINNACDN